MRPDERALVPLLAVLVFLVAGLLRDRVEPPTYAPTVSELAGVLADTGRVRAWSSLLGDDGLSVPSGSWDAVATYLVTTPDGRTGHVSVSATTLRSGAEAALFFDHFGAWLESPAGAPGGRLNRAWPTLGGTGPEPEQSRDFRQVYPDAEGRLIDRRSRLMRDRMVVALVSSSGAAAADRDGLNERERTLAFERTAAWVKGQLLGQRPRGST